jgi:micrococcal nuclease
MYEYRAKINTVVDGDTLDVTVDLGFNMRRDIRLRLLDIDTAETYGVDKDTKEYKQGIEQTEFVKQWCDVSTDTEWPFIIRTEKKGSFGRYLATVTRQADGQELTNALKSEFDNISY